MEDLIKTFHIDWKLIIAQFFNFAVVIIVLGIFALKPLLKMMKEREDKIAQGVSDSELIEKRIKEIEKEREKEVNKGRKEAQRIINEAEASAEQLRQKNIAKVKEEAKGIIDDAKKEIERERKQMIKEVKMELGGLIALALGKISAKVIDEKIHKKLIDNTIEEIKKSKIN